MKIVSITAASVAVLVSIASAEPNPICPGVCVNGGTTCGEPTDCADPADTCKFNDACIPSQSAFVVDPPIVSVMPASVVGPSDVAPWGTCGGLEPPAFDATGGVLTVTWDASYINYCVGRMIPIAPGHRYFVRAEMKVDDGAEGHFDGYGPGTYRMVQGEIQGKGDWRVVGFTFDNRGPVSDSELELRFFGMHNGGPHSVQLRNVAVTQLRDDLGVYLRVTVPARAGEQLTFGQPLTYMLGDHGPVIGSLPPQPVGQWIDIGSLFDAQSAAVGLQIRDEQGAIINDVTAHLDVAYGPSDSMRVWETDATSSSGVVGFYYQPGSAGRPNPLGIAHRMGRIADLLAADPARFRARDGYAPVPQPQIFASITGLGWQAVQGLPLFDDWSAIDPVYTLLHDLGINGLYEMSLPAAQQPPVTAAGLTKKYTSWGQLGAVAGADGGPYDPDGFAADLAYAYDNAGDSIRPTIEAYAGRYQDLTIDLMDEAYGLYFRNEDAHAYDAAFQQYLRDHAMSCADPADPASCPPTQMFGVQSWADVHALEMTNGVSIDTMRPVVSEANAAADRLFYWKVRFWSEATAQYFARQTALLQSKIVGPVQPLISPQLGSPLAEYGGWRNGTELQTMARAGAMNGFWGEAFTSWNDWCEGQNMGVFADWVDGELDPWQLGRRAAAVHPNKGAGAQKALALAAREFDVLVQYLYGPAQLNADGVAGFGELSMWSLEQMQKASATLARVEPALATAEREDSPVAMLAPQSDPLWWQGDDHIYQHYNQTLASDEIGIHRLLTHSHYPVRFLVEERLADDLPALTNLNETTKVLFVQRRHLSNAAYGAIKTWVEVMGGTLILVGQVPTFDEYGQSDCGEREPWFGVSPGTLVHGSTTVTWAGETFNVTQPYHLLVPEPTATTVATYADGAPAVVDIVRGAGKIRVIGFEMGTEYLLSETQCSPGVSGALGRFPMDFSPAMRTVMQQQMTSLVAQRTSASNPFVEVVRVMRPDGGGAVALMNYTTRAPDDPTQVTVTIGRLKACQKLQATAMIAGQPAPIGADDTLTLSMGDTEVISWPGCEDVIARDTSGGCDAGGGGGGSAIALALAFAGVRRRRRRGGHATGSAA